MNSLAKKLTALGLSGAAALSGGYLIVPWEGKVVNKGGLHTVYKDSVGIPTACYGQTGKDLYGRNIRMGMTYTEQECVLMLSQTIKKFESAVDKAVKVSYASDWQKAALISFSYNVGEQAFRDSTLLRKLNAVDHAGACKQLIRWVYADGKWLKGLFNRRTTETQWCMGNVSMDIKVSYESLASEIIRDKGR